LGVALGLWIVGNGVCEYWALNERREKKRGWRRRRRRRREGSNRR
jgi:hypothetical protein